MATTCVRVFVWLLVWLQVAQWAVPYIPDSCYWREYIADVGVGESCPYSYNCPVDCTSGTQCESHICKLSVGQPCSSYPSYCVSGSQCDSGTCRLSVGESCSSSYCVSGSECDSGTCRLSVGQTCSSYYSYCVSGSQCNSGTCRLSVGQTCSSYTSYCVSGSQCDSGTCKLSVGQTCSSYPSYCVSGSQCDSGTCRLSVGKTCSSYPSYCVSGSQCDSGTCRLSVAQTCSSYPSYCVSGSQCESGTCRLSVAQTCSSYPSYCVSGSQCDSGTCRRIYGSDCIASSECQNSNNQDCLSVTSTSQKKCLCTSGYFRKNTNDACQSVSILVVGGLIQSGNKEETRVMVQWTKPSVVNSADYRVSLYQIQPSTAWSSNPSSSLTDLTPGQQYTVYVWTRTVANPLYDQQAMVVNTNPTSLMVYTKPAVPGKLKSGAHKLPKVTLEFSPSNGTVEKYTVTVNGRDTQNVSTSSATFSLQEAETTHNVTIVAISHGIPSDQQTDTFYVDAAGAGVVSNLQIPSHGGRCSEVTWQKPAEPNGDLTGYTVRLLKMDGTCVSGVAVLCSDCRGSSSTPPSVTECLKQSTVPTNKSHIESGAQVNVTGLQPDVNYTVRVSAYNQKGRGMDKEGVVKTEQEAALSLKDVTISTAGDGELQVSWDPEERTGPTSYSVSWRERESLTSNNFLLKGSVNVTGYENTRYLIQGLLNYWDYEVSVSPFTPVNPPAKATTKRNKTRATVPGVVSFTLSQPEDTAQTVILTAQCPEERQRNGDIIYISYTANVTKQGATQHQTGPAADIPVTADCQAGPYSIAVDAEASYIFTVFAKTSTHSGIPSSQKTTIAAKEPSLKPPDGKALAVVGSSGTDTVTVNLCPCVVSADQGSITLAGITLCVPISSSDCAPESVKQQQSTYAVLPTWKQFMKNGGKGRYRVTDNDFSTYFAAPRVRRSVSHHARSAEYVSFIIGNNITCNTLPDTVFCNGPLPQGTRFQVIVWACTTVGCTEADVVTVTTLTEDTIIAPIVGTVAAVAVVAAIVAVVVLVLRRRKQACFRKPSDEPARPLTSIGPNAQSIGASFILRDFATHLERLHENSDLLFRKEFKVIEEKSAKHCSNNAAVLDANKRGNHSNILPFKLATDGGSGSLDFINASYIPGYTSPREYIATQGPVKGTVSDFWKMVWEEKSSLIVMLSELQEKKQPTTDMYWPEQGQCAVHYDDIVVKMTQCDVSKFTVRTFTVCKKDKEDDVRQVTQYFLSGWKELCTGLPPDHVLDFIAATRQKIRVSRGPVIVHCRSGVGLTAVFMALDFLMQFVEEHQMDEMVNVFNLVMNMRKSRPLMVQSEKQYIFIHDTLKIIIDRKLQPMQGENDYSKLISAPNNEGFEMYARLQ